MTHDELLERINHLDEIKDRWNGDELAVALRAVVELHKPKAHFNEEDLWCEGCYPTNQRYPCPTIKAIEKELQ